MEKPADVRPGDVCITDEGIFALHAGEAGWVEDVFEDGVSLHFPVNPTGCEFWYWSEIHTHCPKNRESGG